ncbi:MAG: phytanoyl-CoA dioxygenase family protein [Acidimicrobiales bacterium]
MTRLTTEQIDQYWADGYVFPVGALSPHEAGRIRADFEHLEQVSRARSDLPEPFDNYARTCLHLVSTTAASLAAHPALLDIVEPIIGPDILCWAVELIAKEPHTDKIVSMHQDLTYWGLNHPDSLVSVWVALSEARVANGAMRFVRGSHRLGQVDHRDSFAENNVLTRGQHIETEHDPDDEVAVELDPGQVSLHHGHMFHSSGPNATDGRRLAAVIRYVNPNVEQVAASRDFGMLVRGVNRTSNLVTVAPPLADLDPAGLALHAEVVAAQSEALAEGARDDMSYLR